MKKIGRGWQYTVYDLENGRVLKRYNTWFDACVVMLKDSFVHKRFPVLSFSRCYYQGKRSALESLKKVTGISVDARLVGYPRVIEECEYEQMYAEPLSAYFARVSLEEGKQMIHSFVSFTKLLIDHSMLERNCNIADNFGLDSKGGLVLIDLGEICFSQNEIREQLARRVWAAPDVVSRLPQAIRTYFVAEMDRAFIQSR